MALRFVEQWLCSPNLEAQLKHPFEEVLVVKVSRRGVIARLVAFVSALMVSVRGHAGILSGATAELDASKTLTTKPTDEEGGLARIDKDRVMTTKAVGEEGGVTITNAIPEDEAGGGRIKPPNATTLKVGEEGGRPVPPKTTLAVGEEGGRDKPIPPDATTLRVGEEGGTRPEPPQATTLRVGEEGGGRRPFPGR